jgi:hypothetical protein
MANEEKQLCWSMFHVLQDPLIASGHNNQAFWKRNTIHYNNNRPLCCVEHLARSLKTKWGMIKHNVTNFCGNCQVVATLNKKVVSLLKMHSKKLYNFSKKNIKNKVHSFSYIILVDF